jgi:hypothetical protein
MNEDKTRLAAANLLLERGIRFKHDAPFLIRCLRLNRITIRPLYPGTIAEFSRVILDKGLANITAEIANKHMESICKVIAIAMLNDESKIDKKADKLAKRLQWKVPAFQLIQIFRAIESVNSMLDFMIITNYFNDKMNQLMTMKN